MPEQEQTNHILAATRYGHKMLVNPNDYIGKKIISSGAYDYRSIDLIRAIFNDTPCRTMLDIGANIGNHTLAFSDIFKRIVGFEPGTRAYKYLSKNVSLNNLGHITTINAGLSDESGTTILYVDEGGNLGGSTIVPENKSGLSSAEEITLINGDEYISSNNITDVDFIKVDVEGHEQAALTGLKNTINQQRPLVLMESDVNEMGYSWITDLEHRQELFNHYQIYSLMWNTDMQYWKRKPLGVLRRHLLRILNTKSRVLTPYIHQDHTSNINNLLLVPQEKLSLVNPHVYP